MKLSANGFVELERSEGLKLVAYLCSAKVWTIGIGTTIYPNGVKVKKGDVITKEQAYEYASHDIAQFEIAVNRLVQVPLNQNQFDALISFVFNVGAGSLAKSTLLERLNQGDYKGAEKAFAMWNKETVNGKKIKSKGLADRRKREAALFAKYANSIIFTADASNEPIPHRTLPLPTLQQTGAEPATGASDKQKITATVAGASVATTAALSIDPSIVIEHAPTALSFLQSADWRVAIAVIGVVIIGCVVWWWRRK